jgi:hypothetical protein
MGSWKTGPRHYEDFETGICSVQVLVCIIINGVGREDKLLSSNKIPKIGEGSFIVCVCEGGRVGVYVVGYSLVVGIGLCSGGVYLCHICIM